MEESVMSIRQAAVILDHDPQLKPKGQTRERPY